MSKILVAVITGFAIFSVAGCGAIGKGKGKAPPPAAVVIDEPEPVIIK